MRASGTVLPEIRQALAIPCNLLSYFGAAGRRRFSTDGHGGIGMAVALLWLANIGLPDTPVQLQETP